MILLTCLNFYKMKNGLLQFSRSNGKVIKFIFFLHFKQIVLDERNDNNADHMG